MKSNLSVVLALVVALVGCGGGGDDCADCPQEKLGESSVSSTACPIEGCEPDIEDPQEATAYPGIVVNRMFEPVMVSLVYWIKKPASEGTNYGWWLLQNRTLQPGESVSITVYAVTGQTVQVQINAYPQSGGSTTLYREFMPCLTMGNMVFSVWPSGPVFEFE